MRRSFLLVLAGIATALACGTQIPTTGLTDDGDGGTPPPMDSGGGTGDGQTVAEDGSVPPPTGGNGNVDPCEEGYQPGAKDLYVAQNGSPEKECGTTAMPCTLAVALERRPQTINIADGDYPIATPVVWTDTTIRIFGGWTVTGAEWKRTCQEGKVHIKSLGRAAIEMKSSAATLSYIDVESKTVGGPGESLYGLLVTQQSRLTLDHVRVKAGQGGANPNGIGKPPVESRHECAGVPDGKTGQPGDAGAPGDSIFGPDGIDTTSRVAAAGTLGGAGHLGTPGTAPDPAAGGNCKGPPILTTSSASSGGGTCTSSFCMHLRPNPGVAGCGGFGGTGGAAGGNGGSSVALYVSGRSTVSVVGGSLESGPGGAGGSGTEGGDPASGQPGAQGESQTDTDCPFDFVDDMMCTSVAYPACTPTGSTPYVVYGGDPGGVGGNGGKGGTGGNGAGGHSYAWARDGSSSVELTATPLLKPGTAGAGANADAGTGKVF